MNALYTAGLTPRLDVSDEVWRILFEDEPEPPKCHVRVQFERLDEADRKAVIARSRAPCGGREGRRST